MAVALAFFGGLIFLVFIQLGEQSSFKDCLGAKYATTGLLISYTLELQLDWPWIAEWSYADIFAVAVQIQNQNQFWISH